MNCINDIYDQQQNHVGAWTPPPGETFSNFKIDTKTPKYQNGYKEPKNKTII